MILLCDAANSVDPGASPSGVVECDAVQLP